MGDHYGHMFLTLVTSIVDIGYPHANERDRSSKGGRQRLCHQVRCPCSYHQCRCQQPYVKLEGVPGVEHYSSCVRRRRRRFSPWIMCRWAFSWGCLLLRECGRTICCMAHSGRIISIFKMVTCQMRVVTRRSCSFPFTVTHNIQPQAGQCEGS